MRSYPPALGSPENLAWDNPWPHVSGANWDIANGGIPSVWDAPSADLQSVPGFAPMPPTPTGYADAARLWGAMPAPSPAIPVASSVPSWAGAAQWPGGLAASTVSPPTTPAGWPAPPLDTRLYSGEVSVAAPDRERPKVTADDFWPVRLLNGFYNSMVSGATLPGDVYAGRAKLPSSGAVPGSVEFGAPESAGERVVDLMGMIAGGGLPRRSASETMMASKSADMYNPIPKKACPFEVDYPHGAQADEAGKRLADEAGKLLIDIEGRPLTANYVAGRRVLGGRDEAISPKEYVALAEGADGAQFKTVAPGHSKLKGPGGTRDVGFYDRKDKVAYVSNDLYPDQAAKVSAHELSHHIDTLAGYIPISRKAEAELKQVYSNLATGTEWQRGGARMLPNSFGYGPGASQRELVVEGIRAYMADPNYFKTVAPEAAKAIRAAVNSNPRLNKAIQFNTMGNPFLGALVDKE
jgi:hypothetical protein